MLMNESKIILDLCGGTGSWSKPYKDAGYDVRVITLPEHDVRTYIAPDKVYGILAAPPCTEFSFAKSNFKYPRNMRKGMGIVKACLAIIWEIQYNLPTPLAKRTNLKFWALENPMGLLKRYLGNPVFRFNPYDFGDAYKKDTGLWGYFNMPKKKPCKTYTKDYIHTISPNGKSLKKFDHLLNKEINYTKKTKHLSRTGKRAITPSGFANAFFMANK